MYNISFRTVHKAVAMYTCLRTENSRQFLSSEKLAEMEGHVNRDETLVAKGGDLVFEKPVS